MATLSKYWPGQMWTDMNRTLRWLLSRQGSAVGNWLANALLTAGATPYPTTPAPASGLIECGIESLINFATGQTLSGAQAQPFPQQQIENIVLALPAGLLPDNQQGPDGYPINASPIALPWGNLLVNSYEVTSQMQQAQETLLYNASSNWITAGSPQIAGVIAKWQPGTRYTFGQMIVDGNGNTQMALVDGVTCSASVTGCGGNNNPPNWPTTLGALTADNTQVWKLIALGYKYTGWVALGYCFNLLNPRSDYRVDVFVHTDVFYYMGSSALHETALGNDALANAGTFSVAGVAPGQIFAVLYPSTAPEPASGWYGAQIPTGWVAHSNMGLGYKLAGYKAQIFVKTDIEYLQEDNVPLMVEADEWHARAGSSVWPSAGMPTVHILYDDPVNGWTQVYSSLEQSAAFEGMVRSLAVPTSDPLYVPDPTATNAGALQNRSFIYDDALAILAFIGSGNYSAALEIIEQIEELIQNPGYLPSLILENAEEGGTANWSKSDASATIANVSANSMSPEEPPYGTGEVIEFQAAAAGDEFTYVGSGLPDSTDTLLQFEHYDPTAPSSTWNAQIGVTTKNGKVTLIEVTNAGVAPASLSGTTITLPIGFGGGQWRTTQVQIASLISELAGDTLTSITSFKITLGDAGDVMYLDNLSVGTPQPAGSLSFSYDVYYGQVGEAYIRTGAMAWLIYAIARYIQFTQDFSPVPTLISMIDFLLTLQSADNDLRKGFFYLGYGEYANPGYQFVPGLEKSCSTEHNLDVYFAFYVASQILALAATQQLKVGAITQATATSYQNLATQIGDIAEWLGSNLLAMLYTAPSASAWGASTAYPLGAQVQDSNGNQQKCIVAGTSGTAQPAWPTTLGATVTDGSVTWELTGVAGDPGHFAQGIDAQTSGPPAVLDVGEACDASGVWAALLADAEGNDTAAVECLKFAYQKFLLTHQTIQISNQTNSWNMAYSETTPFSGMKFYNDSPGGYSGSPLSVSQEMTWGMILALLRLYSATGLADFFAGLGTTLDAVLSELVTGQYTVSLVTGDGSLVEYSLASRDLPWEFDVWPAVAGTAWMWLAAMQPSLPLSTNLLPATLPVLQIPEGASQTVDDQSGSSSVGTFQVTAIDPSGTLKALAAEQALIGATAQLKMGFPGLSYGDFVPLHTVQITEVGWDSSGRVTLTCADLQRWIAGSIVWAMGGPGEYLPGTKMFTPVGPQWLPNAFPVSDQNPRFVQGNPLDIVLAALQNELGVGQDPALAPMLTPSSSSSLGLVASNPFWKKYVPGQPGTLINPNQYIDVPGILALRDGMFGGDWFEFKITSPMQAKSWLEMYLLRPLGLVTIVHADGRIGLKPMKNPVNQTPVWSFTPANVIGIPKVDRAPLVNMLTLRMDVNDALPTMASRAYGKQVTEENQASINQFRKISNAQIESTGVQSARGGFLRGFLLASQMFSRYAFNTVRYHVTAFLSSLPVEIGDYVTLTHSAVPDFSDEGQGALGLSNVLCEVIERKPDYAKGQMQFTLLDTRFMNLTKAYQVAPASANVPTWSNATAAQREQYMFISASATGGENADGSPGNEIF